MRHTSSSHAAAPCMWMEPQGSLLLSHCRCRCCLGPCNSWLTTATAGEEAWLSPADSWRLRARDRSEHPSLRLHPALCHPPVIARLCGNATRTSGARPKELLEVMSSAVELLHPHARMQQQAACVALGRLTIAPQKEAACSSSATGCHETVTIWNSWCFTFALRPMTSRSRLSWKWAPDKPGCLKWPE